MKIDETRVRERVIETRLTNWPRILPAQHRRTPAGAGYGLSRFSSPTNAFRVLYAARDFSTSFAEAVVRDRFESKSRRYLYLPYLESLCITAISSNRELRLLDLRKGAAYELGVDTDATRARKHTQGQNLAETLYAKVPELDGLVFESRLTGGACVAVFERALSDLTARPPIALVQAAQLSIEIKKMGIVLRRKRGYAKT
ncbi:RES family NAD+ phosphorylase [Roseovarius sp. C03]|uniref:RES family NAD+ phosphorylase n=1 Tax=Roseovarius sp. C03 TaxID=3449222 RepID=UPI003EDBBE1F